MKSYTWKEFLLDLLVGFAVLAVGLLPGMLLGHFVHSNGLILALCGAVFFLAAALRARPYANPLVQGLGISLGAGLPALLLIALAVSILLPTAVAMYLLLLLVCMAGALSRRLFDTKQLPLAAAVVVVIAALGFVDWHVLVPRLMNEASFKQVDKPSPAFTFTRLDGTPVTLASLHGKVVVLDFWATWCAPCQAEMPTLLKVYRQFQNNPDVVYVAVATGWDGDTQDKVSAFVTRKHFPFPVALDLANATHAKFDINTIPTQILIDRNGHMRLINTGYSGNDDALQSSLTSEVQQLLTQ